MPPGGETSARELLERLREDLEIPKAGPPGGRAADRGGFECFLREMTRGL